MAKLSTEIEDFSKYEPLRLDGCTVIFDLKAFFDSHRQTVQRYEARGSFRLAKPYKERGILAMKLINEIDERERREQGKT
jgi:hypothetical protein